MLVEDALRGVEVVRAFDGPIVDVGSGNGSPGARARREAARPRGDAARLERAQVRVPRARGGGLPERDRRARARGGAGDGSLRRRGCEGARPAAGRARMGAAARPGRRRRGAAGSGLPRTWTRCHGSRSSSAARRSRSGADWPSRAKSPPLQRVSRDGPAWPGNVLSPDQNGLRARADLRRRQPEGRGRQDDHCGQPRSLPREGGRTGAARRSRPAGERDLGARGAGERDVQLRPARRRPAGRAREADALREPRPDPVQAGPGRNGRRPCAPRRRRALPRGDAGPGDAKRTRSSSSTARPRSGR